MATWTTTTTDDQSDPSLSDKVKAKAGGLWGKFKFIVSGLVIFFFIVLIISLLSAEYRTRSWEPAVRGSEEWSDFLDEEKAITVTEDEMYIRYPLILTVSRMRYGSFELIGPKAREFGDSCFPENEEIKVTGVKFDGENNTVTIRYNLGVNRKVVLEFHGSTVTKTLTKYNAFSGGNLLGFAWWHTGQKFVLGYPRYQYTATVPDNYPGSGLYNEQIEKSTMRRIPFSRLLRLFGG